MTLRPLFAPTSVAVVGASATAGKAGHALMRSLETMPGTVHPVNPAGGRIAGRTAYPRVTAIPEPIDLAVLAVPPAAVPEALDDCGRAGVRAAVICAGGFAETGPDGARLQERVATIGRAHGIRLLGPNTSGFVNPLARVHATFLTGVNDLPPGPAAIVAQSGGVNLALSFLAAAEGLGLALGVGLGNAVDVGFADVLDHLAGEDAVRVIGLHVEGTHDGRALYEAVGRLTADKPVAALAVGRADVGDFARSHTGALTGAYALTRASLAQAGAVVVDDPTELVDAMRALAGQRARPTRRPGVGVVTGQAGPGLIIADLLRGAGTAVPPLAEATVEHLGHLLPPLTYQRNPVDTGRPSGSFGDVLAAVAADPAVDAMVVYALEEPEAVDPTETLNATAATVPVIFGSGGPAAALDARQKGLTPPLFRSPDRAARAVRALTVDAAARARRAAEPPAPAGEATGTVAFHDAADEFSAKRLLAAAGMPVPPGRACQDRAAAAGALAELGAPVVVKLLNPELPHKSEHGGVHLGVRTDADLERALDALDALAARLPAPSRYLVERQAPAGTDLIIGATRDPSFGPTLLLARGGVDVEVAADPVLRLVPITREDAREMVESLPAALRQGYRGAPPLDVEAVIASLLTVASIIQSNPGITELDVNPLRLTPDGPLALDALVVEAPAARPVPARRHTTTGGLR